MPNDNSTDPTSDPAPSTPPPDTAAPTADTPPTAAEADSPAPVAPGQAPDTPTAQIPASEPFMPAPEPLPDQPSTPVSVSAPILHTARDLAAKARAVIQGKKRKKLDKVMEEIAKHGTITNDQVEKLLHVSDATATRYLSQLEKEGKIKQEGKTGKSVRYSKL